MELVSLLYYFQFSFCSMEKEWDLKARDVSIEVSVFAPVRNHTGSAPNQSTNHHEKNLFVRTISIRDMTVSTGLKWKDICDFTRSWIWSARKTFSHPAARIQVKSLGPYNLIARYHFTCYTSSLTLWCLEPTSPKLEQLILVWHFWAWLELKGQEKKKKRRKIISYLNFSSGSVTA